MRRTALLLFVCAVAVIGLLLALAQRTPPPETPSAACEGDAAGAAAPILAGPASTEREAWVVSRRLRLVDIGTMRPVAKVSAAIAVRGEVLRLASDEQGILNLPEQAADVVAVDPPWRLFGREQAAGAPAQSHSQAIDVFITRTRRVHVTVEVEGAPAVELPVVTLNVQPLGRPPAKMYGDKTSAGTAAWFVAQDRKFMVRKATSDSRAFDFEYPAIRDLGIVAGAPGYEPASRAVDLSRGSEAEIHVAMVLRPADRVSVRVTDGSASPLQHAYAQLIEVREGSPLELNPWLEDLIRASRRAAAVVRWTDERGMYTQTVDAWTTEDGTATLPSVGLASRRYLVVWAAGHAPFLSPLVVRGATTDVSVRLEPVRSFHPSYRFTELGNPLDAAAMNLTEFVDGQQPALPTMESSPDGSFPSEWIVPGREYFIVLRLRDGQTRTGWVTFGKEQAVDTQSFSRRRRGL